MTKLEAIKQFVSALHYIHQEAFDAHEQLNGALINPKGQLVTIHSGLSERNLMKVVDETYDSLTELMYELRGVRATLEEQCEAYAWPPKFEWFKSPREVL